MTDEMWTRKEWQLVQRVRELEAARDEARATKDMFKERYKNADKELTDIRRVLVDAIYGGEEGVPEGATVLDIAKALASTVHTYRDGLERLRNR